MRFRSRSFALAALLLAAIAARAAEPRLVVDLNPGLEAFDPSEGPDSFYAYTAVNGRVVFLAQMEHGSAGQDLQCGLWVTDGTAGATERLAEFCGEAAEPYRSGVRILASTGAVAFLTDFSGKLWRTDGTAAGTFPLADVEPGGYGSDGAIVAPDGRTFLFTGCTPAYGCELWRSDGTREGTMMVRDLLPGSAGSLPFRFTLQGGRVLFATSSDGFTGGALWATDGTPEGTVKLFSPGGAIRQILLHGAAVYLTVTIDNRDVVWALPAGAAKAVRLASFYADWRSGAALHDAPGRVLITVFDHHEPVAFWMTDGTRAGTRPLVPRAQFKFLRGLSQFATLGTRTLFTAATDRDSSFETDLWYLDPGMKSPRRLLGCPGGCPRIPEAGLLAPFQGRILFPGKDPAHGFELWSTDGTAAGTRLVKDLCPGPCDGVPYYGSFPSLALGRLLFKDLQQDVWLTDGTEAGTVRFSSLTGLPQDFHFFFDLAQSAGRIFFTGVDATGPQPWASDLTPGGTGPIRRIGESLAASGRITGLTAFGGKVLFAGCDGAESAVWSSDGTAAGTIPLPGTQTPCQRYPWVAVNRSGNLAFFAFPFTGTSGGTLWRTDGTATGTVDLLDLGARMVLNAAPVRGKLLFRVDPTTPPVPYEPLWDLWTSDGTPQGTQPAFQLRLAGEGYRFAPAGDALLFSAQNPDPPFESYLWITDGTEAGSRQLLKIQGDPGGTTLTMARLGNKTFFIAAGSDRNAGFELWSTDGTAAGTAPVIADENAPRPVFDPASLSLVAFQGQLYFFASAGDLKHQALWRSDGTAAGTRLIRAIDPPIGAYSGIPYFLPALLTPAGDQLFFRADDGVHGVELWKTDGTPEGTVLVKDIAPGRAHARLSSLAAAGAKLYFAATDGEYGTELWESDGTAAGTKMAADLFPGPASSSPEQITAADGKLFFTATDGDHGRELWVLPLTP